MASLRRSVVPDIALAAVISYVAIRLLLVPMNVYGEPRGFDHRSVSDDLLGFTIVWVLVALLLVVTRQRWLVTAALLGIAVATWVAHGEKLETTGDPLIPSDLNFLGDLGFLASQTDTRTVAMPLVGLGVAVVAALYLDHRRRRALRLSTPARARRRVTSLALAPVLALSFATVMDFNRAGNVVHGLYGSDIDCCPFDQVENHDTNGFVGAFLSAIPTTLMQVPDGYGRDAILEIAERYTQDMPDPTDGLRLSDVNLVLVLGESLADPTRLEGLEIERDPRPLQREREAEGWYGSTAATYYGAGTSTMEYQVLTGQSIAFVEPQIFSPYQSTIASRTGFPSAVEWLSDHGSAAIAIHPYDGRMYQRRAAYDTLGFDRFVEMSDFEDPVRIEGNPNISDATAFETTLTMLRSAESPTLVNLVTMQNHLPFRDWYADPPQISGLVGDEDSETALATWIAGLEYSDSAFDDFLTGVAELERPTVVVYYGDHYPPILPDELLDANPRAEAFLTPLLVWANVPVADPGRDLGVVDTTDLVPMAAEMIGAPLPPYYRLLQQVQDEIGSVGRGIIIGNDRAEIAEADLSPAQRRLLHDYRLVQYDFSVGEGYGLDRLWYDWAP
ncbi:alkaline phosphatase family protein [Aeromicrobium alkaliterrae]|uniref:Alkaline phosphatase family protein n=1 Tax=Aeromicrobium alkaliterrae TaxID=302168 RepID=A0ABP4VKH8_9ACTN